MSIMTSQILKFVDFTKTQKSIYLETFFFLQIKKFINLRIKGYIMARNSFAAGVTFKKDLPEFIFSFVSTELSYCVIDYTNVSQL